MSARFSAVGNVYLATPRSNPGPAPPDARGWRKALVAAGIAIAGIAIANAGSWALGVPALLQLDPTLPPLHYNASLGFAAWGGAFLALGTGRFRLVRILAFTLLGFGLACLADNLVDVGLRLDHWWLVPPVASPPFPAGISPGLSLAFALGGIALFASARERLQAVHTIVPFTVGVFLASAGPFLLLTRMGEVLDRPVGVTLLGAVAVAVAGLALLASVVRRGLHQYTFGRLLPISVGTVGAAVTFGLWLGLNADQNRRVQRQVQFEAANLQRLIHDRLADHTRSVESLAEEWPAATPERRTETVGTFVGRLPGCLGVARVDGVSATWLESTSRTLLPKTFEELGGGDWLTRAVRQGNSAAVRPPRSSWRGTRVLIVFAPFRKGAPDGGLISVVRVHDLLGSIVQNSLSPGYAVAVVEKDDEIFGLAGVDRSYFDRWNQQLALRYGTCTWQMVVWPTRDVMERDSLSLPRLALLLGLATTALLALTVYLAQTARRRAFALENEIRERARAQRELRQSEEKYRILVENLGQAIFLQDRDHRFIAANARFCQSVGRSETEIVGATEADLFEPQRAQVLAEEVRTVLNEGKSVETEEDALEGSRRVCYRRVLTPVRDAGGQTAGVLGICWDVTEQRQLEVHVHQASKMDAIGQLAGGIAHDFNNLLTVILGNLELMLPNLADGTAKRDFAISARNAAARATSLTQRLLGFSRRHQLDWLPANLNATVAEVVELLQRTIDPLIRIETHCDAELWPILSDPAQLNQVLMNLCLNARDAIAGTGRIVIETSRVTAAELAGTTGWNAQGGDYVRLRVADTGSGMTAEVKARMYEPFFTTKEVGKGTGLGLPMVFGIVRQHKGWIECWSEVGQGTRFDVYLPRGEVSPATSPDPAPAAAPPAGKGTVLVVDDEEMIRQLAGATLRAAGYAVLFAEDGQQAITLYSRERERIDLVLLDLTMPVLSGHEAFRHLLALNPRVRVLFASGYAVEQLTDLEKELMAGFINKPYRPNDLVSAVQDALHPPAVSPPMDVDACTHADGFLEDGARRCACKRGIDRDENDRIDRAARANGSYEA